MTSDAYLHDVDEEAGYTTLYIRARQSEMERVITMKACFVPGAIIPLGWTQAIVDAFARRLEGGCRQITDEPIYYTQIERARTDGLPGMEILWEGRAIVSVPWPIGHLPGGCSVGLSGPLGGDHA